MNFFSFLPKFSLPTIVIGFLSILLGLLVYNSYDIMADKLGFETKTSLQKKISIVKTQLTQLESANKDLANQMSEQEIRHKKELRSTKEVLDHVIAVNKKLDESKVALADQNQALKKKVKKEQDTAYVKYSIPKDLYYVYLKVDVDAISSNNYDSLFNFSVNELHDFNKSLVKPEKEKIVPETKAALDDYETVILALAQTEEY